MENESLFILAFIFVVVLSIAFARLVQIGCVFNVVRGLQIWIRQFFSTQPTEEEVDITKLRESLIHGGHGSLGKLTGKVELEIGGQSNGSAAVCISRDLNVMHWWRATGENGTNLLGNCIDGGEVTARSIVAAIRLWGKWWESAESVTINSSSVTSSKMKTFVTEQLEDCQNKYGVRVIWREHSNYFDRDLQELRDGGQELVQQLVRGEGVGQEGQGLHNINLRVMNGNIFQLVNHNNSLDKHYFSN